MCKDSTTNLTNQKSKDKHARHPVHSHKDILHHIGRLRVVPDGCCRLCSQIKAPNISKEEKPNVLTTILFSIWITWYQLDAFTVCLYLIYCMEFIKIYMKQQCKNNHNWIILYARLMAKRLCFSIHLSVTVLGWSPQ